MQNRDPSKEIQALEERRDALEKAIKVALNIEQLHKSLEATLLMGQPSGDIPPDVLVTFEKLDGSTKESPVAKLKETLAAVEKAVKAKLDKILKLSEMEDAALDSNDVETLLNNYRKQAQTAVAMRVLLHSRGVATDPAELHIPSEQIRARLTVVEHKEKEYRKVIRNEVVAMTKETERMLANQGLSESMRQFLTATMQDMQDNLQHLDSGKSIRSMPVAIVMVEMSEHAITTIDTTPTEGAQQNPHDQGVPEIQKHTLFNSAPIEPSSAKTEPPKKKGGFFRRLYEWTTTPDDVTWKDTKGKDDKR